jgi:hypothetical protein
MTTLYPDSKDQESDTASSRIRVTKKPEPKNKPSQKADQVAFFQISA